MVTRLIERADDEALVARVRAGDVDAFGEIVRRYRTPLIAHARRMLVGTSHDPEDVVQDALLRTYAALQGDDRPVRLGAYLHVIVRNRAFDLRRAAASRVVALPELLPSAPDDVAGAVETRETLCRVVAAVGALPERQRLALVGQAMSGRSHAALAGELGSTPRAVKSLVHRARQTVHAAVA